MVKGFKVFNSDWTCRGFQYEVGKTYEHKGRLSLCGSGFHFCQKASDCFNYYSFNSNNKVAEVIAHGEVLTEGDKSCTDNIEIVREITWMELLTIVNEGKDNTGLCNTGNCNTGNSNTGDWNTGNRNTGDWNTGNCNTGNRNTGDWNTGNRNTGDWNTGNCNTGNWNTGDCNTGNCNTGDWNTTKYSSGVFCSEMPKALIFDKPSDLTLEDWWNSDARYLLNDIQTVFWVNPSEMTDQEKELHPEHEIIGGFLKTVHMVEAAEKWWNNLINREKDIIKAIPNFDAEKFYNITGIRV